MGAIKKCIVDTIRNIDDTVLTSLASIDTPRQELSTGIKLVKIMLFCAKVVNMATLIGPKWAHKQLILIFTTLFEVSRAPKVF